MYSEDDLLPISALQHLMFCERQCALIHLEHLWVENRWTAEGQVLHERVHERGNESRGDVRIFRGVRLRSLEQGLTGIADVVEFHRASDGVGASLPGASGAWRPFPVEYKRGRPKPDICDEVQLCAQALCLEEMLAASIDVGAIFYGQPRRRHDVAVDQALRESCREASVRLRELLDRGETPPPVDDAKKCRRCSLSGLCLPRAAGRRGRVAEYLDEALY